MDDATIERIAERLAERLAGQPPKMVLSVEEAQEAAGVGRTTLYAAIAAGELDHFRIGRAIRIAPEAVSRWLESHRVEDPEAG